MEEPEVLLVALGYSYSEAEELIILGGVFTEDKEVEARESVKHFQSSNVVKVFKNATKHARFCPFRIVR